MSEENLFDIEFGEPKEIASQSIAIKLCPNCLHAEHAHRLRIGDVTYYRAILTNPDGSVQACLCEGAVENDDWVDVIE